MMPDFITISNLADILGTSIATVQKWGDTGVYPMRKDGKGRCGFYMEDLRKFESIREMIETNWDEEAHVVPLRDFTSVELFAGAGGVALGMHLAGFKHVLLNEMDEWHARHFVIIIQNGMYWKVMCTMLISLHYVVMSIFYQADFPVSHFRMLARRKDWMMPEAHCSLNWLVQ